MSEGVVGFTLELSSMTSKVVGSVIDGLCVVDCKLGSVSITERTSVEGFSPEPSMSTASSEEMDVDSLLANPSVTPAISILEAAVVARPEPSKVSPSVVRCTGLSEVNGLLISASIVEGV